MTTDNPARPDDEPVVLDADEVLDPASVPLTDREPVIDRLRPAQRELLFRKHAMIAGTYPDGREGWRGPKGLDETDIASMLEVAWLLGLDPFTPGEIWCARSEPRKDGEDAGRLLVMIGRDGRRKIVQRNRLRMRGDVVREEDEFRVWHSEEDGTPLKRVRVMHSFSGGSKARGAIIGSWSEVWDPRTNETRGFFFAPVEEYDPTHGKDPSALSNREKYSPWNHQKTAMMKAAVERQSTSEATPLSGLIGEGEAEINQAPDRPVLGGDPAGEDRQIGQAVDVGALPAMVQDVLARAERLGHAGLAYAATAEMFTAGKPDEVVAAWVADAHTELDQFEQHHQPRPEPEPEPQDVTACGATDPVDDGRRCTRPKGHDGMHQGGGMQWDSFLSDDAGPDVIDASPEPDPAQERLV